jgi:hypothetical protein
VSHGLRCLSIENSTASITYSTFSRNLVEAQGGDGVVWADAGALLVLAEYTDAVTTVLTSTFGPSNEAISTAGEPGTSQRASGGAISVLGSNAGTQELLMTLTTIGGNRVEANGSDGTAEGGAIDVYSVTGGWHWMSTKRAESVATRCQWDTKRTWGTMRV